MSEKSATLRLARAAVEETAPALSARGRLAGHGPTLFAELSKLVDLRLVSRLEFGSGAVAIKHQYRPLFRNCYTLWIALGPDEFNDQVILALLLDGWRAGAFSLSWRCGSVRSWKGEDSSNT